MDIGPSARLEGHFSPVTPLPDAVKARPASDEQSAETVGMSNSSGQSPPPSPEQSSTRATLTDGDSDDSGMSLSSGETDPELCIIGRAMALRAKKGSTSPPWSDSSPDSPVLPPGAKATASTTSNSDSDNMTDYKLMSNSKGDDLYAELLQAQGVDVSPRDEDDRGPSAFSSASTIKAEAADSATWRCVVSICGCLVSSWLQHPYNNASTRLAAMCHAVDRL